MYNEVRTDSDQTNATSARLLKSLLIQQSEGKTQSRPKSTSVVKSGEESATNRSINRGSHPKIPSDALDDLIYSRNSE